MCTNLSQSLWPENSLLTVAVLCLAWARTWGLANAFWDVVLNIVSSGSFGIASVKPLAAYFFSFCLLLAERYPIFLAFASFSSCSSHFCYIDIKMLLIWNFLMYISSLQVIFWMLFSQKFVLPWPDSVERFHISAFLLFVLAQNILEAEGPWFESFVSVSSLGNPGHYSRKVISWNKLKVFFFRLHLCWLISYFLYFAECSRGLYMWNDDWHNKTLFYC